MTRSQLKANRMHRFMTRSLCLSVALAMAGLTTAKAETLQVLDHLVLGETKLDGEKIGEFSAMVRDPSGGGVLAISDRGYIAEFAIDTTGDRLARLELKSVHVLTNPDGKEMRDLDFNPEGATVLEDGTIAIVDENGPSLAVFDRTGKWLRDEALPEPLRDAAKQVNENDGVESLGWTAASGFVATTEAPHLGQPNNLHTLHTTLAGSFQILVPGTEVVSIKSIEVAGPRLFILERTRDAEEVVTWPWLRIVDLPECLQAKACVGQQHPISVEGITDADFEGLAALGDGLFLMVSDDKIDGDLRSVFVLFRIG
jgi:Esterase-like activity of phytase